MNPTDKKPPEVQRLPQTPKQQTVPAHELRNKKVAAVKVIPQSFNRQTGHAHQPKPVVAQLKTGVSAQSVKSPVAPPAYRPQPTPRAVQPQMAHGRVNRTMAVAPPVYRPQPVPRVLQTKTSLTQSPHAGQAARQPVAPPVYRPETKKIVQPQAHPQLRKAPTVPSSWHSKQETPQAPINRVLAGVAQLRPATPSGLAHPRPNSPQPRSRQSVRGLPPDVRVIQRMETTHSSPSQFTSLPSGGSDESGPVKTSGGTWIAKEYVAKMGHEDPSARGLHIRLEFHPEHPTDATKIVLVQTVLAFRNDDYYFVDESVKKRSQFGVSIDQSGQSVSPVYADDPAKSASTLGSTVEKGAGGHGYCCRKGSGGIWHVAPAWLVDNPHLRGVESFSQQIFETTAIAVAGNDAGAYYGSVRWGWTWKLGGILQLVPLSVISRGSASERFRQSAERWNMTKTIGGKEPLQLPEVRPGYSKPAKPARKPPQGLDPRINNRFDPHDDL